MQNLYLLTSNGCYKIGVAHDVRARIASLQTGNPSPISLVLSYGFENAEIVEKVLHQKFEYLKIHGEWFTLNQSNIDAFIEICDRLDGVRDNVFPLIRKDEIEEAETEQEHFLDNPDLRIEVRRGKNGVRGFAFRERQGRKASVYVGKRHPDFERILAEIEGKNEPQT